MLSELTRRRPNEIVRAALLFFTLALMTIFGALDSDPTGDVADLEEVTAASAELDDGPAPVPPSFTPAAIALTIVPLFAVGDPGPTGTSLDETRPSHRSRAILRLAPKQSPPTPC